MIFGCLQNRYHIFLELTSLFDLILYTFLFGYYAYVGEFSDINAVHQLPNDNARYCIEFHGTMSCCDDLKSSRGIPLCANFQLAASMSSKNLFSSAR